MTVFFMAQRAYGEIALSIWHKVFMGNDAYIFTIYLNTLPLMSKMMPRKNKMIFFS